MIQSSKRTGILVKDIVLTGLLTALVFISTFYINIKLPISINGGLIHCGNIMLFLSAIVFGKRKGAIAGAFGMGLFDVVSGWMPWAPFTFIIRGLMGYLVGSIAHRNNANGKNIGYNLLGIFLSGFILLPGYFIAEVILYGNWVNPLTSLPGDVVQLVVGCAALILAPPVIKAYEAINR